MKQGASEREWDNGVVIETERPILCTTRLGFHSRLGSPCFPMSLGLAHAGKFGVEVWVACDNGNLNLSARERKREQVKIVSSWGWEKRRRGLASYWPSQQVLRWMESETKMETNSSLLTYVVKLGWINFPGKDVLASKLMCYTMVLSTYSELGISKYDRGYLE